MSTYKSEFNTINCDINTVYSKLSQPATFRDQLEKNLDKMPDDAREHLEKVHFEADGISIDSPMGPMKLSVAESVEPSLVRFAAQNSPVAFHLDVELEPVDAATTRSRALIDIDLPFFMRTMVGNHLGDAVNRLGEMLARLPYNDL
ncbi:MAG: hypothetical protein IJ835_01870 [Muribaculaceae bacterium]|nr:hypothetical protein [Muribaculaceae bacterium]